MILSMSLSSWLWEFLICLSRLRFLMQNNTMVSMVVLFVFILDFAYQIMQEFISLFKYVERTHHDVMSNAETAEREGEAKRHHGDFTIVTCFGLSGCCASGLHAYSITWCSKIAINYSSYHTQPFYLGHQSNAVDSKLLQQHPPSEFSCCPRLIQHHLRHLNWKLGYYFIHCQFYWIAYPLSIGITMLYWWPQCTYCLVIPLVHHLLMLLQNCMGKLPVLITHIYNKIWSYLGSFVDTIYFWVRK